ncbi:protein ERGIC-53 [Drosophila guanche]|uniref:Blast:Protein ERGIC-53 n=1 Tax=Drosophila guanche TaxID=7266 RepID=A0A3B0KI44_DROGU|nr:protein ERGIC-53 [Drosophila guanche]SPP85426.1 blast:Protein ERGIC-53 [Drosophila guanche]
MLPTFCKFLALLCIFAKHTHATTNLSPGAVGVHRRFEYKYSFKPPYLAQKDGTVPFWEYGGNAIASSESVRVAPSLRSQKGAIWTKTQTNFDWWDVEIVFRVTGRGRIGADGLAFWYTTEKGDYNGPVFGSSDRWNGLGIIFDSFDNDNKHNNPYISAVVNDGTKMYDHTNDGTTQLLSGCLRDFRNKPFPTRARIEYYNNVLTVLIHNGMTNNNDDYELCMRSDGVNLPKNGYFGISAATGGLADDHDVFHFLTTSLHAAGQVQEPQKVDNQEKLTAEYNEYQDKLEKQKLEYKKDHPNEHKDGEEDWEEFYESENQRELRQIWQGQSQIADHLRELSRKVDEIIGRQENTLTLVSRGLAANAGQALPPAAAGGVPQQQLSGGGVVSRSDVDLLLTNQNVLLSSIREIRQLVGDINVRTDNIQTNQKHAPTAQIQSTGYDVQTLIAEMRDGMNQVKQGISHVGQKLQSAPQAGAQTGNCPTGNCVGVTLFLSVTVVQLLLVFIYNIFKNRSEAQAKKFY